MTIVFYIIFVFLMMVLGVTVFNILTAPKIDNGPRAREKPFVSVIIPARNEQDKIKICLKSITNQDYPNFEIIVVNDRSTDKTGDIVRQYSQEDKRVTLCRGKPLQQGWTGKNWACFQGTQCAKGDIYIFTDADNFFKSDAVSKTVGWMQKLNLDLISAFPQQICTSVAEKWVVPVVDMLVYSFLPLWLTYYSKFPSLAAANGQWLALTRNAYEKIGGHQAVRTQVVEDVELSRTTKKMQMKILTTAGTRAVMGRMYSNWRQVKDGFTKNAFGLVSYQTVPLFILLGLFFLAFVMPYILIFSPFFKTALLLVFMNLVIRTLLVFKYKHPLSASVVFHPIGIILYIYIALLSFIQYQKGHIVWKGRSVKY